MKLGQSDGEWTEIGGLPATWRFKSEAGGVHKWNDRKWSPSVRKVNTANAAFVLELDANEILVDDVATVAGWLECSHREHILWWDFHNFALFLLISTFDLVLNFRQVQKQLFFKLFLACFGSCHLFFDKSVALTVIVAETVLASNGSFLLDEELYVLHWQPALLIVHVNQRLSDLLGSIDILFKCSPHAWNTLIDAAPSLYFTGLFLFLVGLERDRFFSDRNDLLVLHISVSKKADYSSCADSMNDSFYPVLDLGLGFLGSLLLVVNRTG